MLLAAEALRKQFGTRAVVDDVTVGVEPGTMVAVIGPNGAGKTTLLNLLSGYLPPSAGRIAFDGRRVERLSPVRRCKVGMGRTFQQPSFFPELTAVENVQVALLVVAGAHRRMFGTVGQRRRALELLEQVGLAAVPDVRAASLSYGDQRRLELGIALGTGPRLLLLDEPMAGMSATERTAISRLMKDLHERNGLTIVFTEHDMDVVFDLASTIHVLHQGRLLASGAPEEIRAHPEVRRVYLGEERA